MAEKKTTTAKVTSLSNDHMQKRTTVTVQDGSDSVSIYVGETDGKAAAIAAAKTALENAILALENA